MGTKVEELKEIVATSQNIVFFGGAGVSTESDIPDFRSEEGLYRAKEQYGYSPEQILSYSFFVEKPDIFFRYYKHNLVHKSAVPNQGHKALATLERKGKLSGIVTQNIDGLHQKAGSENVQELHGSYERNYCMKCFTKHELSYVLDQVNIPKCSKCGGIIRPDVVLYEEALDSQVVNKAVEAIRKCDTLIVGGTSLVVYPAAGLIEYFSGKNLVLINKSKTSYDNRCNLLINESIGSVLAEAIK